MKVIKSLYSKKIVLISIVLILITSGIFISNGLMTRVNRYFSGVNQGVMLENKDMSFMLEDEVRYYIEEKNKQITRKPSNARIDKESGEIIPAEKGEIVNITETVEQVMASEAKEKVDLVIITLEPELTGEVLESIEEVIGSFSTGLGGGGGRVTNITLASNAINNHILHPGEIFSFNNVVGPTTIEKGYQSAPIIVGGSIVPGIGGGICQVSTTLYNAAKNADLKIIERYPHSKPIGYVPKGMDATVSNHLDFRFQNSSHNFIKIKSYIAGYQIYVQIVSN